MRSLGKFTWRLTRRRENVDQGRVFNLVLTFDVLFLCLGRNWIGKLIFSINSSGILIFFLYLIFFTHHKLPRKVANDNLLKDRPAENCSKQSSQVVLMQFFCSNFWNLILLKVFLHNRVFEQSRSWVFVKMFP